MDSPRLYTGGSSLKLSPLLTLTARPSLGAYGTKPLRLPLEVKLVPFSPPIALIPRVAVTVSPLFYFFQTTPS